MNIYTISILRLLGITLILSASWITNALRLSHSDLTETQLFIHHWEAWLVVVVLCIVGYGAISARDFME